VDRGKLSAAAFFGILGMVCAGSASAIPEIKETLSLTDRQLGVLMLAGPVGTGVSYIFAAPLVALKGSRTALAIGTAGYMLAVLVLASCFMFNPPLPLWIFAMALIPAFGNILNISVNTQGGIIERRMGKSVMGFFHGNWSLGNLVCSVALLGVSLCGIPISWRLVLIALVCTPLALVMFGGLEKDGPGQERKKAEKVRLSPGFALVQLGLVALLFLGCEGAVFDWVGVFYKDVLKVATELKMLGYCAVMAAMTLGRFLADRIVNRTSPTFVARLYSTVVSLGLAYAFFFASMMQPGVTRTVVVTLCYAVTGFGLSGLAPLIYSAAARSKSLPPAAAVTFVSSIGFIAYFVVPPMVGTISSVWGLGAAFAVYAVLILVGSCVRMR